MPCDTYSSMLDYEITRRVAEALIKNDFNSLDKIPFMMRPKGGEASRCCIYRDRMMIRYRCMAVLGFSVEDETDDSISLAEYASKAMSREKISEPVITFLHEACESCVRSHYEVTLSCHKCLARPCVINCPKNAISIIDGKAAISPKQCIKCGLCLQACPYHAIVRIPIPCEEACPVAAISKDEDGKEAIDYTKCIYCGKCVSTCPFAAVMEKSQIADLVKALKGGYRLSAMIAPSTAGQVADLKIFAASLRKFGFASVIEVAIGADEVSQNEAAELVSRLKKGDAFMTSSCCPAYHHLVERHMTEISGNMSRSPSPMSLTAEKIKKGEPENITVFIGPCVAKKREGIYDPHVDIVVNFKEMSALLEAAGVSSDDSEEIADKAGDIAGWQGRGFGVCGGISAAIKSFLPSETNFNPYVVNGLDKNNIAAFKSLVKTPSTYNFFEVAGCKGGCVGGPSVREKIPKASARIKKLLESSPDLRKGNLN